MLLLIFIHLFADLIWLKTCDTKISVNQSPIAKRARVESCMCVCSCVPRADCEEWLDSLFIFEDFFPFSTKLLYFGRENACIVEMVSFKNQFVEIDSSLIMPNRIETSVDGWWLWVLMFKLMMTFYDGKSDMFERLFSIRTAIFCWEKMFRQMSNANTTHLHSILW